MWLKCKAMQDVEVKLPPGLTPNMVSRKISSAYSVRVTLIVAL